MGEFVQYNHNKNSTFKNPSITISKNGQINFNTGTLRIFIKDKMYVILYFDKLDNRIGFKFSLKKLEGAFKIRKTIKDTVGMIAARTFLRFHNIPFIETNKYKAEVDGETKFIVINLKKKKK